MKAVRTGYSVLLAEHFVEYEQRDSQPVLLDIDRELIEQVSIADDSLEATVDYPSDDQN
jgi:hypothetical protein